jgi:tetratricopeptide (TPR) repeat protein
MIPASGRRYLPLLLLCLWASPAEAFNPFKRDDPRVTAGNQLYAQGKYDEALRAYEDAQRELGSSAELAYDRGNALFKLGRQAEAREAYLSALGASDSKLKAQDYYNMGNSLWELERNDEAVQAYERALLLDPGLEAARHNLALLLSPPPQPDAGQPDGGQGDGGGDGGSDGGSKGGGRDGGSDGGSPPDGGQSDGGGQQNQKQQRDGGQQSEDGGQKPPEPPSRQPDAGALAKAQPLDKLETEQLLDALRQREKNLQLWKFRQKQQRTKDAEKDW